MNAQPPEKGTHREPRTTEDQLRELLGKHLQAASDEAIRSDGQVPADRVEALGRLSRLVDLYEASKPSPARKRWPVAVALGSTLLVVSLLLFARVRETEIELELAVSEISFTSPVQQVLTEAINLSSLGLSGFRVVNVPGPDPDSQRIMTFDGGEGALRLSLTPEAGERRGSITLAPLSLPKETRLWVRHTGSPGHYRLSLKGTDLSLRADINGSVQVAMPGTGIRKLDLTSPDAFRFQSGSNDIDLDLALPDKTSASLSSQLPASALSLFHIDEFIDARNTLVRRVSTILSGTLYLVSLNDQERKLRPGEAIQFERVEGEFRTLLLQDDHMDAKFHGRARGMTIGSGESRRSLMPTWLEWLTARHSLSLLWGAALYLFGLVSVVFRWWGKPI
jgi:hypothetical protein